MLRLGLGAFSGVPVEMFEDCLFASFVAYTSLGYGDHVLLGHARLLTSVEALNGLVLIGWSASFTYLAMERYWPLHGSPRARTATTPANPAPLTMRTAEPAGFALDQGPGPAAGNDAPSERQAAVRRRS